MCVYPGPLELHCMMVRWMQKEHMMFNVKVLRYTVEGRGRGHHGCFVTSYNPAESLRERACKQDGWMGKRRWRRR